MGNQTTQDTWTPLEARMHIDLLEPREVRWAYNAFLPLIQSQHVWIMSSNMMPVFYINKLAGMKSLNLCIAVVHL